MLDSSIIKIADERYLNDPELHAIVIRAKILIYNYGNIENNSFTTNLIRAITIALILQERERAID